jgi:hypothetical protein
MTEELKEKEPIPEPETEETSTSNKVDRVEEMDAQQVKDEQEADAAARKTSADETGGEQGKETPPPMPPRPQSPFTKAQSQLQEAFPSIEPNVIRAVLVASGGKLDPAFNALLSMSDPDFKPDEALQSAAAGGGGGGGVSQSQIEQDEALARQLAEQEDRRRGGGHPPPPPNPRYTSSRVRRSQDTTGSGYSGRYDDQRGYPPPPERSFFDDDLPEIRDNLQKGFNETRDKFNSWMTNLRKKMDNEEEGAGGGGLFGALGGNGAGSGSNRSSAEGTRPAGYGYSSARTRRYYDRDPDEISSDFQGISLRDEENPPPKPSRPQQQTRQVSALGETQPSSGSKWEPLKTSSDKPEEEKDPFFIGESDDDDDTNNNNQSSSTAKKN